MTAYAADTRVPVEKSRGEIEQTLKRYGCTAFVFGWSDVGVMLQFEYKGRNVKLDIQPAPGDPNRETVRREERRRWRVLLLWVKATLEAVDSKMVTFEEAFLPWTLLEGGQTVAQKMIPQLPPPIEPKKLRAGVR